MTSLRSLRKTSSPSTSATDPTAYAGTRVRPRFRPPWLSQQASTATLAHPYGAALGCEVLRAGKNAILALGLDIARVQRAAGSERACDTSGKHERDVGIGRAEPGGLLPITFPTDESATPIQDFGQYPGVEGVANYTEELLVGYRWYQIYARRQHKRSLA
jgi:hypothetical protein